jgi:hypothetical protein
MIFPGPDGTFGTGGTVHSGRTFFDRQVWDLHFQITDQSIRYLVVYSQ